MTGPVSVLRVSLAMVARSGVIGECKGVRSFSLVTMRSDFVGRDTGMGF
jgi:hypothetical protein